MSKLPMILGLTALGLAVMETPAVAADVTIRKSAVVSYADLNLENPAGARVLYWRIKSTAARLCGPAEMHGAVAFRERRLCIRNAVNDAVAKVNQPMVSNLHRSNTGSRG